MSKSLKLMLFFLLTWALFKGQCQAMDQEYSLKAGFLYNFARYGSWPNKLKSQQHFNLCSTDQHFNDIAQEVIGKQTITSLPIKLVTVELTQSDIEQCQLLFVSRGSLSQWNNKPEMHFDNVMVVGETPGFIESGGHIRFFLSASKIRFEISPDQLKHSGVMLSSKVIRLGRIIEGQKL